MIGSSRRRRSASWARPWATKARWRWPPESACSGRLARSVSGHRVEGPVDSVPVAAAEAPHEPSGRVAPHRDGLADGEGQVLVHLGALQHVGDAARPLPGGDLEPAGPRRQQSRQGVEQGALAGAVGPDEGGHRPGGDREGGRFEDDVAAVGELHALAGGGRRDRGASGGGGVGHGLRMITNIPTVLAMRTVLVRGALAAGLLVGLAACGDESGGARGEDGGARIVVTTSILGDVVSELVGDDASVEVLMPPGSDPHDFAPSARQAADLRECRRRRGERPRLRVGPRRHDRGGRGRWRRRGGRRRRGRRPGRRRRLE